MKTLLLAQAVAGYGLIQWLIVAIVVAAIIGVVFVVIRQTGIVIPPFIISIFWILLAAVVGIVAIRFLWSLL